MEINCIPLKENFEFCINCDMITPFDSNAHCYICGCDHPLGDFNDYSIPIEEWDKLKDEVLHLKPFTVLGE